MAMAQSQAEELRTYLATCSPDHADQIIRTLRESLRRNGGGRVPTTAAIAPASTAASAAPSMPVSKVAKTGKKQRNKKAKQAKLTGATGGPKRPLNSWMAFRKYYNGSLAPHTQMTISKVLMAWWREDPFEAKWAMLAKTYSVLRGSREKEDAPLDEFFRLCAPLIGVISPDQYPQMMGWQLAPPVDSDQNKMPQVIRVFIPNLDTFSDRFTTTNLSVDNLVEYCMSAGYIQASAPGLSQATAQGVLTMAVQPTATVSTFASMPHPAAVSTEVGLTTDNNSITNPPLSPFSFSLAGSLRVAIDEATSTPSGQQALATATSTITAASAYPYNTLFDPTAYFDVSFNPAEGIADAANYNNTTLYNAFDPSATATADEMLNLDWTQFVNEDGML